MLKMFGLLNVSRPKIENSNGKVVRYGAGNSGEKFAKKSRKSKDQNLFKSQKTLKSKKLSKSENLLKFNTKKVEPNILTPDAKEAFNFLWLAFTKASILWYFDLKCHIWIKIDVSSYALVEC